MTPQGPHKFPLLMTAQNKDLCSLTRVAQSSRTSWVSQPSPHFSVAWQPLLTGSSAGTQHCNAQASSGSTNQQGKKAKASRLLTADCSSPAGLHLLILQSPEHTPEPVLLGDSAAHRSTHPFQANAGGTHCL